MLRRNRQKKAYIVVVEREGQPERRLSLVQVQFEFGDTAIDALMDHAAGTTISLMIGEESVGFTRLPL